MTEEQERQWSVYRIAGEIAQDKGVQLVQHMETGDFYVRKMTDTYSLPVFQRLQALRLPGIPVIYEWMEDYDQQPPVLTVIEEWIPGKTLWRLLQEEGVFTPQQTADIVCQLCDILQPLHEQKPPLIHRDIKPENIMLLPDGTVRLLDFNIARFYKETSGSTPAAMERDTRLLGTQGYAAPEQFGAGQSEPRTDIYALGVLLNELLTGCLPTEVYAQGGLLAVIRRCTEIDPRQRYRSVSELRTALRQRFPAQKKPDRREQETEPLRYAEKERETGVLRSVRSWCPPGFRSGVWWKELLAGAYYLLAILIIGATDAATGQQPATLGDQIGTRFLMAEILVLPVFLLGNWHQVWRYLPGMKWNRLGKLRYLLALAYSTVIGFVLVCVLAAVVVVFGI